MFSVTKQYLHWLTLLGLAFFAWGCSSPEKVISFSGSTMGTTYHIKALFPKAQQPNSIALQKRVHDALELVNDQMSTYRPDSELSRFNQMDKGVMHMSDDTSFVVKEALRLHKLTHGSLDISVGPLVNLWGFGPDQKPLHQPSTEIIERTKAKTGLHQLVLRGHDFEKRDADLYLDLSSIAKGFGVDKIAELLDSVGASSYMVEIGGETKTKGMKPEQQPWRIAIEQPLDDRRDVALIIEPGDQAVATSGDYRNFYEEKGLRVSHILDPTTGYPIAHYLASVTVLHSSCMTADALATAMIVMGVEKALKLANAQHFAVMLIEKKQGKFKTYYSDEFRKLIKS
tara:strand:- start:5649 stop:6674 length:1026 start_codon:yes stop_codon:yes gene_type:complete